MLRSWFLTTIWCKVVDGTFLCRYYGKSRLRPLFSEPISSVDLNIYFVPSHVARIFLLGGQIRDKVLVRVRKPGRSPGNFRDFAFSGPQIYNFKHVWTLILGFWFAKLSLTIEILFYLPVTAFKDTTYGKITYMQRILGRANGGKISILGGQSPPWPTPGYVADIF